MPIAPDVARFKKGQTAEVRFTLRDETEAPIPLSAMTTLTLTLYDRDSDTILNSRNAQNVLNTNNVTMHATSGLVTWTIQPADVPVLNSRLPEEVHVALFKATWQGGARAFPYELLMPITNIHRG